MELGKVKGTVKVVDSEAILAEVKASEVVAEAPTVVEVNETVTQDA